MKRIAIIILTLTVFFGVNAQQQQRRGKFDVEKFKKERIDFLVKEIGLTDQESKAFIPLCDELLTKKFEINREARRKNRELRQKGANATNVDYEMYNELQVDCKIKEAELDKEYYKKMKTILSAEKIHKYQMAEKQFVKKIVNQSNK
ncbi:hypothetical protein [Dysgonomonas sp. 520]|uniref:hypothetical protein n=1 Tax=Dysgonomonas sp. 520 TaxID=2302931 RepID=UPI0013D43DCC|nr:hypothetical protein [Dysgonomonas sp. 520]NDW09167.1 hypothetical protein [Dysgonomonas sp. 520]